MMEVQTIQVGYYAVNCSLLIDGASVYFVDPGFEGERLIELVKSRGLSPKGILLTHAHFDHVGAINTLQKEYPELPVYVHPNDLVVLNHPLNSAPPEYPKIKAPVNIRDARELDFLEVIETPGHTPGGVCYYLKDEKLLLSGDTLFASSIGRTDFPGGSMSAMMASLKLLAALPDDTRVIPGHGAFTSIGFEKSTNPYL